MSRRKGKVRGMEHDPFASIQPEVKAAQAAEVPDIVPPTEAERLRAAREHHFGPLTPPVPLTGALIRANCRFCGGRGCLNCDTLANQEYHRQFPHGPELLVSLKTNDPEDMALLPRLLQDIKEAQTTAEVVETVREHAAAVRAIQEHLATHDREAQP